jgi:hypothetical protein
MSTTQTSREIARAGVTIATVLFGDDDPAAALAKSSAWPQVVDRLGQALDALPAGQRDSAAREIRGAAVNLLGLRLGDVLFVAWRAHRALVAAARATVQNAGATELVQLATHRITSAHHPYVDVVVNEVKLATLHFDLSLVFDIDSLLATVRQGRLVALASGRCVAAASLACEGLELASRQSVFDPLATLEIGDGLLLAVE